MLQTLMQSKKLQQKPVNEEQYCHERKNPSYLHLLFLALIIAVMAGWSSPFLQSAQASRETKLNKVAPLFAPDLPSLESFRQSLKNGQPKTLVGVYVPGVMALQVIQQPGGNPAYVSGKEDVLTQFSLASSYDTIGLLAHNNLAGTAFFELKPSQNVVLIYGDGRTKYYSINAIDRFQALSPNSPYTSLKDLSDPDTTLSVENVFYRIYGAGNRVVFQTCIEKNGNPSWGRIFVTAVPLQMSMNRRSFVGLNMY